MSQLAIRLHPCVPVSNAELFQWLEEQVAGLRADAPEGTIRLSSLTQAMPTGELDMGWLVELDLPDRSRSRVQRVAPPSCEICSCSACSRR